MRDSNIVMLSLSSFLGKVGSERGLPMTDIFGGIEEGIAQIARATFLHVSVSAGCFELARFVDGR